MSYKPTISNKKKKNMKDENLKQKLKLSEPAAKFCTGHYVNPVFGNFKYDSFAKSEIGDKEAQSLGYVDADDFYKGEFDDA